MVPSLERPANQIKPGNEVYLRVKDGDRDLTNDRFGLWIPEIGPDWNEARIIQFLKSTGAADVRVLHV